MALRKHQQRPVPWALQELSQQLGRPAAQRACVQMMFGLEDLDSAEALEMLSCFNDPPEYRHLVEAGQEQLLEHLHQTDIPSLIPWRELIARIYQLDYLEDSARQWPCAFMTELTDTHCW